MKAKIRDLQEALISKGAYLLGEPFVQLKPHTVSPLTEFAIFFAHKTHGVHFTLFTSVMVNTNIDTYFIHNPPLNHYPVVKLSTFVSTYGTNFLMEEDFDAFNNIKKFTDIISLKDYGGLKVLEQEHGVLFRGLFHEVIYLFNDLMRMTDNKHVEHCIYLAKTTNENPLELKELVNIPVEFLPEVISLDPNKYKTITLPYSFTENLQAKRKTLPILKP